MKAIQLYCTSWVGYADNAEHIYCRVSEHTVESLEDACAAGDYCVPLGDPFLYTPTESAAMYLARKDNYRGGSEKIHDDAMYYVEHGVSRFWSLHQVCSEVHKKFPDMKLYGFFKSHEEFCSHYHKENEKGIYEPQDFVVLKY